MRGYTEGVNNIISISDRWEEDALWSSTEKNDLLRDENRTIQLSSKHKSQNQSCKSNYVKNESADKRRNTKKVIRKNKVRSKFKRDKKRNIIRVVEIMAIILFVILLGLYAGKINVLGRSNEEVLNQYYRELERNFTNSLQEELKASGFGNAGITVSSVIEPGVSREYSIKIHHGKLAECTSEELDIIMDRLKDITFPDSSCRVNYDLLL